MSGPASVESQQAWHAAFRAPVSCVVHTQPGDDPYRGEYDCGDCCSMSHCETHLKDVGTYPFDERDSPAYGGAFDGSLDRWPRVQYLADTVLGRVPFLPRRVR